MFTFGRSGLVLGGLGHGLLQPLLGLLVHLVATNATGAARSSITIRYKDENRRQEQTLGGSGSTAVSQKLKLAVGWLPVFPRLLCHAPVPGAASLTPRPICSPFVCDDLEFLPQPD